MTTATGNPGLTPTGPDDPRARRVVTVSDELRLQAAARLISDQAGDPLVAAERFLETAQTLGMDLSLMWATIDAPGEHVRQVCLAVLGAGRTVMLFLSGPQRRQRAWSPGRLRAAWSPGAEADDHRERVALLRHACSAVANAESGGARLAQSLLESREREALAAFRDAGFMQLGDLAYLRRALPRSWAEDAGSPAWPTGVRVQSVKGLARAGAADAQVNALLAEALERSYEQTQDCPELCGLRDVSDVLESHRSVGVYDPALWWIVFDADRAEGCMLYSPCPEHDSVELVYLGLSPRLRGRGLGSSLLRFGLASLYQGTIGAPKETGESERPRIGGTGGITCAVDTRNAPAMRLYKRAGFQRFGLRMPMVLGLNPDPLNPDPLNPDQLSPDQFGPDQG